MIDVAETASDSNAKPDSSRFRTKVTSSSTCTVKKNAIDTLKRSREVRTSCTKRTTLMYSPTMILQMRPYRTNLNTKRLCRDVNKSSAITSYRTLSLSRISTTR